MTRGFLFLGDIPCENSLLRQVSSLLRRLPAMESERFHDNFLMVSYICIIFFLSMACFLKYLSNLCNSLLLQEYNDKLLVTYLAMITNCTRSVPYITFYIKYSTAESYAGQRLQNMWQSCYAFMFCYHH